MSDARQAEALMKWLDEHPGAAPPAGVDPEVLEAVYALRPDLAPAPKLTADELLAGLSTGPLAHTAAQPPTSETPSAHTPSANQPWYTHPALLAGMAAAAVLLIALPALRTADQATMAPSVQMEPAASLAPSAEAEGKADRLKNQVASDNSRRQLDPESAGKQEALSKSEDRSMGQLAQPTDGLSSANKGDKLLLRSAPKAKKKPAAGANELQEATESLGYASGGAVLGGRDVSGAGAAGSVESLDSIEASAEVASADDHQNRPAEPMAEAPAREAKRERRLDQRAERNDGAFGAKSAVAESEAADPAEDFARALGDEAGFADEEAPPPPAPADLAMDLDDAEADQPAASGPSAPDPTSSVRRAQEQLLRTGTDDEALSAALWLARFHVGRSAVDEARAACAAGLVRPSGSAERRRVLEHYCIAVESLDATGPGRPAATTSESTDP